MALAFLFFLGRIFDFQSGKIEFSVLQHNP